MRGGCVYVVDHFPCSTGLGNVEILCAGTETDMGDCKVCLYSIAVPTVHGLSGRSWPYLSGNPNPDYCWDFCCSTRIVISIGGQPELKSV